MKQDFKSSLQKISITIFLLLLAFFIHAQENEKQLKFEQKLNDFRYSLYEGLDTIENFNTLLYESNGTHPMVKKIRAFIAENKQQVIEYREYKLSKFNRTKIDFNYFTNDSTYNKTLNESDDEFWNQMAKIGFRYIIIHIKI